MSTRNPEEPQPQNPETPQQPQEPQQELPQQPQQEVPQQPQQEVPQQPQEPLQEVPQQPQEPLQEVPQQQAQPQAQPQQYQEVPPAQAQPQQYQEVPQTQAQPQQYQEVPPQQYVGAPQPQYAGVPQQQYPAAPQEPAKKSWYQNPAIVILLVVVGVLIGIIAIPFLFFAACTAAVSQSVDDTVQELESVVQEQSNTYPVTYRVLSNDDDVNIYFMDENNRYTDLDRTTIQGEWTKDVTVEHLFGASIMATNYSFDNTGIACQIEANGKILSEDVDTGSFGIVSCDVSGSKLKAAFEE